MNFFNRAIKNITRKLSKSILLVITFFVIGNFVIIGLSVAKASESAKTLTRQKMRAVVSYTIDYDAFYHDAEAIEDEDERNEFYEHFPSVTIGDVKELIKDERVKTANAITSNTWYTLDDGIDYVHLNNSAEENMDGNGQSCYYDTELGEEICETYKNPIFFIKGNFLDNMIEFADGDYTIVQGSFYTKEQIDSKARVCLITNALAQANNVGVGDTIRLAQDYVNSWNQKMGVEEDELVVELEIVGIYDHNRPITPDNQNYDYTYPYENPDNMILIPSTTINDIAYPITLKSWEYYKEQFPDDEYYQNEENVPQQDSMDKMSVGNTTILLNDPLEVDQFVEDYKGNVGQYKKIDVNNEEFKKLSKPLDTLSDYAEFIVGLVVVNAIVIITLVTALTLKTREYEIGVLLSIGASKIKVVLQFFIELALVALIGFTLAVGSGSIISKKVGASLLDNQIQSSGLNEDDSYDYGFDYYSPWDDNYETEISLEDIVSEYDVTVSPLIIGEIYVVGLGIVLISVIIPSIMIMRYNPKKILMNQG